MPSDLKTGNLLKSLAALKPGGRFLELGTGTGLSTAWILEGMDSSATLISLDNDMVFQQVARQLLCDDQRLTLLEVDGEKWIRENKHQQFDFIFADTWPGKYNHFQETIGMLSKGGCYILDDMMEQPNWPEGHSEKVADLLYEMEQLEKNGIITLSKLIWSTGLILVVKK